MTNKFIIIAVALFSMGGVVAAQVLDDNNRSQKPTRIVVDDEQRAVIPPSEGKQVSVLSIELVYDAGVLRSARVVSTKRANAIAPKVFLRKSGDWKVTINRPQQRSFFVNSPGWREAEPDRSSNDQYSWVPQSGVIEWPLIVPLYAGDESFFDARSITIRDTRTGTIILEAEI
jgi:hypothetical protein